MSIDQVLVKYYHVELPKQTEATWQCCGQCQMACGRILGMEVPSLVPSCSHHPTNFQMKSNQPHYLHRFLTDVAIIPLLHEEFLRSFIENSYRSVVLDIATSNLIQIKLAQLLLAINLTCTLHTKQQKHGDNGKKSTNRVNNDEFQRIVIGNEQNVKNSGGRQVACQQTTRIWKNGSRVNNVEAKECDRPNSMKDLKYQKKI